MHLAGGLVLFLLLILPDGALSATATGRGCQRRCGGLVVPYPLGFSGDCPVLLSCDERSGSKVAVLRRPTNGSTTPSTGQQYTVVVDKPFDSTNSSFVVSLPPSCDRDVLRARRGLAGANYGVTSRSGLFVRGCRNAASTNCTLPAEAMSTMLRTAACGGAASSNGTPSSSVACVATISTEEEMARGVGLFARWDKVDQLGCDQLLTSVYADTREGRFSLEFSMAELGWWVNGNCSAAAAAGSGGDIDKAGRCAANATCHDVQTPTGEWGHRCSCKDGMDGDGFAAGDGCFFAAKSSRKKILMIVGGVLAGTVAAGVLLLCCARCRRSAGGGRNILLDGDLRPKLADFGLSRAVRLEASLSHVSTAPQGTPGYLDPEYHQNFHLSDKSDVYSFGVVLLELITAMKVVDFARPAAEVNLASLALDRIGKGRVDDIVDPALVDRGDEWVMLSVRHVSELAFRCLAFQKDVRPCMSEVAAELSRIRDAAPASVPGARTGASRPMMVDIGFDGVDTTPAAAKKAGSPVSVQDVWISDQSSPSTNGSMPRFA
uniref:Protein kinase domain-containing protein n=1 Tax=Oryza brachyantha TaxID=4533 RepID=J3NEN8_ORYBR